MRSRKMAFIMIGFTIASMATGSALVFLVPQLHYVGVVFLALGVGAFGQLLVRLSSLIDMIVKDI